VFKSTNAGDTFSATNTGLTSLFVQTFAIDPDFTTIIYAGTIGGGVFESTDGGDTWSAIDRDLDDSSVLALAIDPENPTIVYIGTVAEGLFKILEDRRLSSDGGDGNCFITTSRRILPWGL
jgi:photosystem II stability/assembly factor-like uncharacterized protein